MIGGTVFVPSVDLRDRRLARLHARDLDVDLDAALDDLLLAFDRRTDRHALQRVRALLVGRPSARPATLFSVSDTFAPTTGLPAVSMTVPVTSTSSGTFTAGQSGGLCLLQSFSTNVGATAFGPPKRACRPMPPVNTGSYGMSGMLLSSICASLMPGHLRRFEKDDARDRVGDVIAGGDAAADDQLAARELRVRDLTHLWLRWRADERVERAFEADPRLVPPATAAARPPNTAL